MGTRGTGRRAKPSWERRPTEACRATWSAQAFAPCQVRAIAHQDDALFVCILRYSPTRGFTLVAPNPLVYSCAPAGQGFGPRLTTSNMEIGTSYGKRQVEAKDAFEAFAPRAVKLNNLAKGQAAEFLNNKQDAYLARAAQAAEKRRIPFAERGGWPTPHGQPWDAREAYDRFPTEKPWMPEARKLADMKALRGDVGDDDPLQPIWW